MNSLLRRSGVVVAASTLTKLHARVQIATEINSYPVYQWTKALDCLCIDLTASGTLVCMIHYSTEFEQSNIFPSL